MSITGWFSHFGLPLRQGTSRFGWLFLQGALTHAPIRRTLPIEEFPQSMKLTSRGEYATRALFFLALHEAEGFIPLARIAQENEMPRKYLEQIVNDLRVADLVQSREGARGGYRLAVDPAEVTIGRILRLLDGPLAPIGCVSQEPNFFCALEPTCGTKPFWGVMTKVLDYLVDRVTLADLVAHHIGQRELFPEANLEIPLTPPYARRAPVPG